MRVLCNFELKSEYDEDYEPWLEDIFQNIEKYSNNTFTVRVTKESHNRSIDYRLDNKKNKTYSIINKRRDIINVTTYRKLLPDKVKYIKPPFELVYEKTYTNDAAGKISIAKDLNEVLDKHNEYSDSKVNKIDVDLTCGDKDSVYMGGVITEIMDSDDNKIILIQTGESFLLPSDELESKRAAAGKFIVMDKMLNFDIFFQSEMSQYFNLT